LDHIAATMNSGRTVTTMTFDTIIAISGHVSHPLFTCSATRCLLALLTDVSGGRSRVTRIRLIVGLITPHRIPS
jgi:hypothetical protein